MRATHYPANRGNPKKEHQTILTSNFQAPVDMIERQLRATAPKQNKLQVLCITSLLSLYGGSFAVLGPHL